MSISTNTGKSNTQKWLFLSFGTFLVAKSKMAAIRHLEKSHFHISGPK